MRGRARKKEEQIERERKIDVEKNREEVGEK